MDGRRVSAGEAGHELGAGGLPDFRCGGTKLLRLLSILLLLCGEGLLAIEEAGEIPAEDGFDAKCFSLITFDLGTKRGSAAVLVPVSSRDNGGISRPSSSQTRAPFGGRPGDLSWNEADKDEREFSSSVSLSSFVLGDGVAVLLGLVVSFFMLVSTRGIGLVVSSPSDSLMAGISRPSSSHTRERGNPEDRSGKEKGCTSLSSLVRGDGVLTEGLIGCSCDLGSSSLRFE